MPPPETLGPAYTVDYDFFGEHVVQTVFPLATPEPAIYIPPGQKLYGSKVSSRWLLASSEMRRALATLGAPVGRHVPAVEAVGEDKPAATESVKVESVKEARAWWWLGLGGVSATALLGLLAWRRQHDHQRHPQGPSRPAGTRSLAKRAISRPGQ